MNIEELTDEQYIEQYRRGDISIVDKIMEKYKNLVRHKAKSMYILGGDEQDLIQEGMIGLFKAVRDYDFGRDASFATFAELCISRQIYNAIQATQRLKNIPLNDYISLYSEKDEEKGSSLAESLMADSNNEPEKIVLDAEAALEINECIDNILTQTEKDVFRLNLTGLPTASIAAILSISPKSADNALQRAKAKLKKELKK